MRPEVPDFFASHEARLGSPERPDAPGVLPRTPSPVASTPSPEVSTPSPMLAPPALAVPSPAPAAPPAEAAPAIHVSIGRVVVRAVTPPAPSRRREAAPSNVMTLDDYLSRRKKRGRA